MSFINPKTIVILGIVAFLAMSFWGLYSMPMDEHGKMADCPFTNSPASLCQMNLTDHIQAWQNIFIIPPQKALALALLALLATIYAAVAILKHNPLLLLNRHTARWQLYIRHNPELSLFNPLREAFARGILNPKIY